MTKVGSVISLFSSPLSGRNKNTSLDLDSGGIIGDKHHGGNIERSVLLATKESYALAKSNGIEMGYGELGENTRIRE